MTLGDGPPVLDPGSPFSFHTTPGQPYDITIGATTLAGAAFVPADPDLGGAAILDFDAFDEWREEDELLVGHARDPFKTVDTRRSSARVVVEIGGVVVADSSRPVMLFETHLPTRYYLPRDDVRMDLLDADGHDDGVRLQGPRRLLVGHRRRRDDRRRGVELRATPQLRHGGGRPHLLLQRAGRHHRRRHAGDAAADAVVVTVGARQPAGGAAIGRPTTNRSATVSSATASW